MKIYDWPRMRSLEFAKALRIYAAFMNTTEMDIFQRMTKDSDLHAINDIGKYRLPYDHNVSTKLILGDYMDPMYRVYGVVYGTREICLEVISFQIPGQNFGGDFLCISIADRYKQNKYYGKCKLTKQGQDSVLNGGMIIAYGSQIDPTNLLAEQQWRFYQPGNFTIPLGVDARKVLLEGLNK